MPRSVNALVWVSFVCLFPAQAIARELTLKERVEAQRAIERVYYSHQLGTSVPFEQAVTDSVLEKKVRNYLKQSVALEKLWHAPMTAETLHQETERIVRNTKFPDRLREIYAALGEDAFLVDECFSRSVLVDRLIRSYFAGDSRFQDAPSKEIDALRTHLVRGDLNPLAPETRRTEWELLLSSKEALPERNTGHLCPGPSAVHDSRFCRDVDTEELERWRKLLPDHEGEVGQMDEDGEHFAFRILLEENPAGLRFAVYSVPKSSYDSWWNSTERDLDESSVTAVADAADSLPMGPVTCPADDTWVPGNQAWEVDGRIGQTAVWTGSLMIIWGGVNVFQLGLGARYDPVADYWTVTSDEGAPDARYYHTAVWTGSSMLIWGGNNGGPVDTGGRYDPATDTWMPMNTVGAPAARYSASAVWTGSVMVVWGGIAAAQLNTGGRYDPATDSWSATSTSGAPTARNDHTAIWTGNTMVIWGGIAGSTRVNTGSRYNPAANSWASTTTSGAPTARSLHTAVWSGTQMIVWGGNSGTSPLATGARYNPVANTWSATATTGSPTARNFHSAVWTGTKMIVWGGYDGAFLNTGAAYDPSANSWAGITSSGAPSFRAKHSAVWTGTRMVIWGGVNGNIYPSIGGRYDPATDTWSPTYQDMTPSGRSEHTGVWTGNMMIVWAGRDNPSGALLNTGEKYDPLTEIWTATSILGAPSARLDSASVWTGSSMLVWGGNNSVPLSDGARYDPIGDSWTAMSMLNAPADNAYPIAVWTGSRMLVLVSNQSGGSYNPTTDTWSSVSPSPLDYRTEQGAVWAGDRAMVYGGYSSGFPTTRGAVYDPAQDHWALASTANAPPVSYQALMEWTGTRVLVWSPYESVGAQYNPTSDTWTPMSGANAPGFAYNASSVWSGRRFVVWGDSDICKGRYDPATDTWTPMSLMNAPGPKQKYTTVWTGTVMIPWGGINADGHVYAYSVADYDHDSFTSCMGDCNDDNAAIHPGVTEICNGLDDNCNAAVDEGFDVDGDLHTSCAGDCNDTNPSVWSSPTEASNLTLTSASPVSLSWGSQAASAGSETVYDLVSGSLPGGPGFSFAASACLQAGGGTSYNDTRSNPATGAGYWYLARAKNSCGIGTYGSAQRDSSIPSCP